MYITFKLEGECYISNADHGAEVEEIKQAVEEALMEDFGIGSIIKISEYVELN